MSYNPHLIFQNLKPGDRIDVQDQEGDWFETIVRKVINQKIVCHFLGFANIWDCTIEFDPSKIAPVHTFSERSKFKDHQKLLAECVWEILSERNMLNSNKECTQDSYVKMQQETGILSTEIKSYLDTADATDSIQLKLCKWVQRNILDLGLKLRIQELLESGPNCFGFDIEIQNNMTSIINMNAMKMKISQSINQIEQNKAASLSIPPPMPCTQIQPRPHPQQQTLCHGHYNQLPPIQPLNFSNINLSKIQLPEISHILPSNPSLQIQPQQQPIQQQQMAMTNNNVHSNGNIFGSFSSQSTNSDSSFNFNSQQSKSDLIVKKTNPRKRKQSVISKKPKKRRKKCHEILIHDQLQQNMEYADDSIKKVLVTKYDHNSVKKEWLDIPSKDELKPQSDGKYRCPSSQCLKKPPFKTYTSTCRHIQIEHQGYRYRCDLCRDEYSTEVEFRSHSTLKIHLQNMHKLTNEDFAKIRIVLSLVGRDSLVKKTAGSDDFAFKEWKQNIINADNKRNGFTSPSPSQSIVIAQSKKVENVSSTPLTVTNNSRSILKKLPQFELAKLSGHKNENQALNAATKVTTKRSGNGMKLNKNINEIKKEKKQNEIKKEEIIKDRNDNGRKKDFKKLKITKTNNKKKKKKDQIFMDKIDALIQNLGSTPSQSSKKKEPICKVCGQKFHNFHALAGHKKKHNKGSKKKKRKRKEDEDFIVDDDDDYDIEEHEDEEIDDSKKINFKSMPQIDFVPKPKQPPPPPPKSAVDADEKNKDKKLGEIKKMMPESKCSIYGEQERKNDLYFQYVDKRKDKDLKALPFGPCWLPGRNTNVFGRNNKKSELIKKPKMRTSNHFGCKILHFG